MAENKKKKDSVRQLGLFNINAKFNFFSSGGANAGGSVISQAAPQALKGLASSGVGQSIPIVGQALAIVTGAVSIIQMISAQTEANLDAKMLTKEREVNKIIREEIALDMWAYNERIKLSDKKIVFLQDSISEQKLTQYITLGLLSISSMMFVYGIKNTK